MLTQVGKYQIVEKIGVGGFGSVYKGRDPFIKRPVAIKTCQSDEEEIKKRFFREAEFAGNLQHRNITTIYDFGVTEEGVPYIVQEFLTGEDLDKMIKRKEAIPLARKVRILIDVCEGLDYAHASGIIHRDIKPSNIRILENGTVKIMDFGIAKSMVSPSTLTQTGITLGTASYLAPEQIRGESVDPRTDIFSLGVLAYELLTYQKPFMGEHISTVLYKILNEAPPPPKELDASVPDGVGDAVMHALEKDRTKRPDTCSVFRDELAAGLPEAAAREDSTPAPGRSSVQIPAMPAASVPRPTEFEETLSTPSGGVQPSLPVSKAVTMRGPLSIDSHSITPQPRGLVGGDSIGDVAFRRDDAPLSSGVLAPKSEGTALKVFLASAAVLLVAGGAAYYFLQSRKPAASVASAGTADEPANPRPDEEPTAEPSAAEPEATEVPTPRAQPTAVPTAAAQPTQAATAAPAIALGSAVVSANYYSTLSIDGQRRQGVLAAVRLPGLKPGRHRAVFETEGFAPLEKVFEVRPGQTVEVRAEFPPRGQLQVQVNYEARDAELLLDGEPMGRAPLKKVVRAGSHRLEARLPGFETETKTVTVPEEDRIDIRLVLKRSSAPTPEPGSSGQ